MVLIHSGLDAGSLLLLRATVNSLVTSDSLLPVFPWLLLLCLVFIGKQVISLVRPVLSEQIRLRSGFSLQNGALQKIAEMPLEAFDDEETHNLIYRVVKGADVKGPDLMDDALRIVEYVPLLITSAIILGLISLWLPVVLICGVLFIRFLGMQFGSRERRFEVENTEKKRLADYYAQLLTRRETAAETRVWDIGETLLERWRKTLSNYLNGHLLFSLKNTYQGVLGMLLFTLVFAVSLFIVSQSGGQIEPGLAALVLQALGNISSGLNSAQYTVSHFIQHVGYSEDCRCLMAFSSPESSSAHSVSYPRPLRKGIHLQGVTYRYPGSHTDALHKINLHIRPGEILGVVGSNGSGKTTLAHILGGLRPPTAGEVLIDGVNADAINVNDIRNACTFVFQHPLKYPTTLRDNVAFRMDNAQDSEVQDALERVGLSAEQHPLETLLGPEFGGLDLSGGEWQRVALARSLLKKSSSLVIFDEPTASLDPLAELELFKSFVELVKGKTTLLIAHRLGPTRLADRVAVLEDGFLEEIGTPAELQSKNGKYAEMFNAQRDWYQ